MESNPTVIHSFKEVESDFLEVLVDDFSLTADGDGTVLKVKLNEKLKAVHKRKLRGELPKLYPALRNKKLVKNIQNQLDNTLLRRKTPSYNHSKSLEFPFRYASGGVLPIVRLGRGTEAKSYYCLIYREINPIGWNLANGATDNRHELLDPTLTLEREMREELIIFHNARNEYYSMSSDSDYKLELPEFTATKRSLQKFMYNANMPVFDHYTRVQLPLTWTYGPDKVQVSLDGQDFEVNGCYLNINAIDHGIEIDRIAWMDLEDSVIICDGEITEKGLINAPIGLFEVDKMNADVLAGKTEFKPDIYFYGAQRRGLQALGKDINEFVQRMSATFGKKIMQKWLKASPEVFNLCPATRSIIYRFIQQRERLVNTSIARKSIAKNARFDVFISYASEDKDMADRVYNRLIQDIPEDHVFYIARTPHDPWYAEAISAALDSAVCLVSVIGSGIYKDKSYPKSEYSRYINDLDIGQKGDARAVSYMSNVKGYHWIPSTLRRFECIKEEDSSNPQASLDKLTETVICVLEMNGRK